MQQFKLAAHRLLELAVTEIIHELTFLDSHSEIGIREQGLGQGGGLSSGEIFAAAQVQTYL
jgi:hypothetical protein